MHELSIAESIVTNVRGVLPEDELATVREIHLRVGILSGIEPLLLQNAWSLLVAATPFPEAELRIDPVDIEAFCSRCERSVPVVAYRFICPDCGSALNRVTAGNELHIHQIVCEDSDEETDQ